MLNGPSRIHDVATAVAADGKPALTVAKLSETCTEFSISMLPVKKGGIKPILGIELYMAKDSVDERPRVRRKQMKRSKVMVNVVLYWFRSYCYCTTSSIAMLAGKSTSKVVVIGIHEIDFHVDAFLIGVFAQMRMLAAAVYGQRTGAG